MLQAFFQGLIFEEGLNFFKGLIFEKGLNFFLKSLKNILWFLKKVSLPLKKVSKPVWKFSKLFKKATFLHKLAVFDNFFEKSLRVWSSILKMPCKKPCIVVFVLCIRRDCMFALFWFACWENGLMCDKLKQFLLLYYISFSLLSLPILMREIKHKNVPTLKIKKLGRKNIFPPFFLLLFKDNPQAIYDNLKQFLLLYNVCLRVCFVLVCLLRKRINVKYMWLL